MKTRVKFFSALLFNLLAGLMLAPLVGVSAWAGAAGAVGVSLLAGNFMPPGAACEGVLREVWTGELIKKLNAGLTATFLEGIPDYSDRVNNDVIHLVDVGADPDVLINNTTYPIPYQDISEQDIPIKLDKYQTKVTRVTDDELYALTYDKMGSQKERHGNSILTNKFSKAIHALAPQTNTAKTPVILTTGVNDNGRRRLTTKDIITLKDKFDKMEVPASGRRLVLCTDHVNDLLLYDQHFKDQYYNRTTGKIADLYGFEVYEFVNNPRFTVNGAKKAFNSSPGEGEYKASVAFYVDRMFKASGSTRMYYTEAVNSPTMQESTMNFRHYYIVLPKKQEAIGAIASSAYIPELSVIPPTHTFPIAGGSVQIAVSASSDFFHTPAPDGFTINKIGKVLSIAALDNTDGESAKESVITLTLAEDATKTATITLNQPNE
jgi:hypothetical protein